MKRLFTFFVGACLVCIVALWVVLAFSPLSGNPSGPLGTWFPLPIACAGRRCVTYRAWAAVVTRVRSSQPAPDTAELSSARAASLLTELLTSRAVGIVARRAGLTVTESEVDAALKTVTTVAADERSLQQFLVEQYGDLMNPGFRSGMRDLLTRTKLAAAGISDVWMDPGAPWVLMLHARNWWNPTTHRVVAR